MATKHHLSVNLNVNQKNDIINAMKNNKSLTLYIYHSQIEPNQDILPLSNGQADLVLESMENSGMITLRFNKKQVQDMKLQIGSGILDSLGSFFNTAKSYVTTGAAKVSNYFKKPIVATEMKDLSKYGKTKNAKAQQYFDSNTSTKKPLQQNVLSPSEMAKLEAIKNRPEPKRLEPIMINPTKNHPRAPNFQLPVYKESNVNIGSIKNPPMTSRDHAIAQWKMEKSGIPQKNILDNLSSGLDKLHGKYTDFSF